MQSHILKIDDEFEEIGTRSVDDRNRLTLGEILKGARRIKLYQNRRGDIFLQPVVEIPVSELWLFKSKEALMNVQTGLTDAAQGRISRLDPDELI